MNIEQTLEEARQALYADKRKVVISLTTKILDADPTRGEAWLIKARAFEKQLQANPSLAALSHMQQCLLLGFRHSDTALYEEEHDILEGSLYNPIGTIIMTESNRYEQGAISASTFIRFIDELRKIFQRDVVLYHANWSTERTIWGNKLALACSTVWNSSVQEYNSTKQLHTLSRRADECVAIAEAIITFCGRYGNPQSAYHRINYAQSHLIDVTPLSAGEASQRRAALQQSERQYKKWQELDDAHDEHQVTQRATFWRAHHRQWYALHMELAPLYDIQGLTVQTRPIELEKTLTRRIARLEGYSKCKNPEAMSDVHAFLSEIDRLTSDQNNWYQRFGDCCDAVLEQDAIIAANGWFFGESGRNRRAAQQTKKTLIAEIEQ